METVAVNKEKKTEEVTIIERLNSQINEERFFKDLSTIQMNRITALSTLAKGISVADSNLQNTAIEILEKNLEENQFSIVSQYMLGVLGIHQQNQKHISALLNLLDTFVKLSKWPIVDHLADIFLSFEDKNRVALRAKVESVGHIKGKKEARSYLEKLAKIDRKNPDVAKKYGLNIIDDDPTSALRYLKQAGETYARLKDYKNLEIIWMIIIQHDYKDMHFFERIERIVLGDKHKVWLSNHLSYLIEPFRAEEAWDYVILILKKILRYEPQSSRIRSNLVRAYRSKYEGHSLLNEFIKLSELTNHKKAVDSSIASFERNIVFDLGNYVYHRTRDVGKIIQLDSEKVIIDFSNNPGQEMSIQMAIHSLQPLEKEHIWTLRYEDSALIEDMFQNDVPLFLETLLSSFGKRMTMQSIKHELIGRMIQTEDWAKWWSRARALAKKSPRLGFNPNKKDELILRDVPMTITEELSLQFQGEADWNKKMEIAYLTLRSEDTEGASLVAVQFYKENEDNKDELKCLHSYFFLEYAKVVRDEEINDRKLTKTMAEALISKKTPDELLEWSVNTQVVELKKDFFNMIVKNHDDYTTIAKLFLFETPIRIHRYIIGELMTLGHEKVLCDYLNEVCQMYREHIEIFLWIARSILTKQWSDYKWISIKDEDLMLLVFRSLKSLVHHKQNVVRLKNTAIETICGTTNITVESLKKHDVLVEIVKKVKPEFLHRLYVLFRDVPYIPDAHKENILDFMKELNPELKIKSAIEEDEISADAAKEESLFPADNVILSSMKAIERRRHYLDNLIHVVMSENSRDIGEAQEKGDLRENSEYKAAMERQSQLQTEVVSVSNSLQRVRVIRPASLRLDVVSIGTSVTLKVSGSKSEEKFTILGPWDVDTPNNVISYEAPLAKALIGFKVGENTKFNDKTYTISEIKPAMVQS